MARSKCSLNVSYHQLCVIVTNTYSKHGAWQPKEGSSASEGVSDVVLAEESLRWVLKEFIRMIRSGRRVFYVCAEVERYKTAQIFGESSQSFWL